MYHTEYVHASCTAHAHARIPHLCARSRFAYTGERRGTYESARDCEEGYLRRQMFETRCRGLARFLPRSLFLSLSFFLFPPLYPLSSACALFLLIFINIAQCPMPYRIHHKSSRRNGSVICMKLILLWFVRKRIRRQYLHLYVHRIIYNRICFQ